MAKIRSKEELIGSLQANSAWRKKELLHMMSSILPLRTKAGSIVPSRFSAVISYSHWEGFVRESSIAYVEYLRRKLKSSQSGIVNLSGEMRGVICRLKLRQLAKGGNDGISHFVELARFMDSGCVGEDVSNLLNSSDLIDVKSNLNWRTFSEVCCITGVPVGNSSWFYTKRHHIEKLVEDRNAVAHGERREFEPEDCRSHIDFTISGISKYSDELMEIAMADAHLAKSE
jgi:hypothetical protein